AAPPRGPRARVALRGAGVLRPRLVLVVATAVAAAVVLASVVVYFVVRNELYGQVNGSLHAQADQITGSPALGLQTQIGPKQYVLHLPELPVSHPLQVDASQ